MATKSHLPKGTIPFVHARFFDPDETRDGIADRFELYLRTLRAKRRPALAPTNAVMPAEDSESKSVIHDGHPNDAPMPYVSHQERVRMEQCAKRIVQKRQAAGAFNHLRLEDRSRLEVLRAGARLISIPSEHRADELAAALHMDMPWMAPATEVVWHAMRRSVRDGLPGLRLPPLLLDGPPGIGKSHWARRLGQLLSAPTTVIEATSENASFGVVGSQRGWNGAHPGRLLETVLRFLVANPVIVVDEIEKAGVATATKGQAFGLENALLPLLETMTAQKWSCPYYQVPFDMSWVIWVLTANSTHGLPTPLLSRCPPISLRDLTVTEVAEFVRRQGAQRDLSEMAIDAITQSLEQLAARRTRPSLRTALRMLRRAADLEQRPLVH